MISQIFTWGKRIHRQKVSLQNLQYLQEETGFGLEFYTKGMQVYQASQTPICVKILKFDFEGTAGPRSAVEVLQQSIRI